MRTLPLGNTGIEVSAMGLGTIFFGTRTDPETSIQMMDCYLEAGGTFVDTANIYNRLVPGFVGGESEALIGRWMRERKNRSKVFLVTKVGSDYQDVKRSLKAVDIERECEKSLGRLATGTIDLYLAHFDDRNTPLEETYEAFDRLVRKGKVRFIGGSNILAWRLEEIRQVIKAHGWPEYCCIQQRYSYLRPKPGADLGRQIFANEELIDYCRSRGILLQAYGPVLRGAYLAGFPIPEEYAGPDSDIRLATLKAIAEETGATTHQVLYAWLLEQGIMPLVGADTVEQLKENLGGLEIQLSDEQMTRLNNASA
ncbi:MAG: aldo/keto reductase [Deltaproteobacteria bacterium]|nr:aldo/keto reductase [Deltaproteobacteria bacterium]